MTPATAPMLSTAIELHIGLEPATIRFAPFALNWPALWASALFLSIAYAFVRDLILELDSSTLKRGHLILIVATTVFHFQLIR